ncbi:cyanophycin synthetase [Sulfuriferula nivalis]|uniref:Cyanophycin synthetase n=1 Tax=Sulfuriferula nivalis TaxID=2675298 RepID=A0A809S3M9_9PROT|nr:cyanophycin synthetase [Sulfuriferula nivalis]BBP01408.1 cyanophycin synthetase [Sulfuriferula nivalis]
MEISRIRALRGPNLWSLHTSIEAIVVCTPAETDLTRLPDFETRLRARFPAIGALEPIGGDHHIPMAHALEIATLELQAHAGCPVTFSRTTPTIDAGTYQIAVEFTEESVGRMALDYAYALCLAAANDTPFDAEAALTALRELDEDIRLGPSTGAIVQAAVNRGMPYRRLTEGSMVQIGWGSRQRRILAAETDATSAVAEAIAQDKELTKMLLEAACVPVPAGRPVTDAEDAWLATQEIGSAVAIKPQFGNQGKGVAVNLETREQVIEAYHAASKISSSVIVERYITGHDYRLLVIGNQLVAAARRDPPHVFGDGVHSIVELVETVNQDPNRGDGHATSLSKIRLDEIALATLSKQNYTIDSIPTIGALVVLRNNANLSTGGTATDVTDDVHPELAARAVDAARMIGLDICGVDVLCNSVHHPLEQQGGGVVEVNAAPGLRMHLAPSFGKPRDVGSAIINSMFAADDNGRIPIVAVAGTNGKTTTVRLTAHLLTHNGLRVGMTNSDGVYISGQRIDTGDCSGPKSARNVLAHPEVDAAVLETARGGVLREGLAFDHCDIAIVTNIGIGDHLGLNYINTTDELAVVKRVIVENVSPQGYAVLNAADPAVVKMANSCPGGIIYFAQERSNPVIATHCARGQRVIFVEDGYIVAKQGDLIERIALAYIPLTRNGSIGFQIDNAMGAIGAAWGLGMDWAVIRRGVSDFVNDAQTAPGRFNVFDYRGATLIADYGHNPDAIIALVAAIERIPAKQRHVVISGAGDRRDQDIRQQTEILGAAFDQVILYQDQCQRGRADGEVLALLRAGLVGATRAKQVDEINGEFNAIDLALSRLSAGDVCLILIDQVDEALAHIAQQIKE